MKLETAEAIAKSAEELGVEGISLVKSYSGRGMFGRTTAAVTFDRLGDLLKCVADAAGRIYEERGEEAVREFKNGLASSTDSMGLGQIAY